MAAPMKGGVRAMLVAGVVVLGAALLAWHPWKHPTLAQSTTVLPATAAAPAGHDDVLAIVYSGDGGWRDLDQQLGKHLQARGIPVLGVSSLTYYWHGGSAEQSARDLDALIDVWLPRWHKQRVWLIGFSFGADVLPTIIGQLTPAHRAEVTQLVLLSPTRDLNFEIELEGYMRENWFSTQLKAITERINPVPHFDALPPLLALHGRPPVACYYGTEESDDTICARTDLPAWVHIHPVHGDHHLGGDYTALAARLIADLPDAAPGASPPATATSAPVPAASAPAAAASATLRAGTRPPRRP
jgi:type IV secretory pathway VirJ component